MKILLSIIIPMYNMEKFISKCLDSVISQSYSNIEILCVNDGSPDRSAEIALEYAKKDHRIRLINSSQNLGLFRARVEGLKEAKGDYVAFVDADDTVSIDWFRLLLKKALEDESDIVIGNTVNVDENGYAYYYNNYRNLTASHQTLAGEDILKALYEQEGACFIWHTVWNKLYSRRLINESLPYLEKVDFHMVMGEDIAFSSVFYTRAKKLSFADIDCYFYYRHSEASTSLSLPKERIIKNILDLGAVFAFMEESLREYDDGLYQKYRSPILRFKNRYQRIWRGNILKAKIDEDKKALDAMEKTFGERRGEPPRPHEFYFYELTTAWSDKFEKMKRVIASPEISVVSFDIFDTLLLRPFAEPADLFTVIGKKTAEIDPIISEKGFRKMREEAEKEARSLSPRDDVTLTEIYETFASLFGISREKAMLLKEEEEKNELKYCYARNSAKELFEFALELGKRVIITSDMYLEKDFLKKLLHKNGYSGYEALFVSSDTGLLKANGEIYDYIVKALGISPSEMVHVGDNWNSDIILPRRKGICALFLPKCTEVFENGISDVYAGTGALPFKKRLYIPEDTKASFSQLPISTAYATVANMVFDNPFTGFCPESSFNGDSYYMGAYGLGIQAVGIAEWIFETCKKEGYKKILFLARDGKMIKEVFDYLCKKRGFHIETEYFYATRKALLPYSVRRAEDFYGLDLIMDVKNHTPEKILRAFSSVLNPLDRQSREAYKKRGVILGEPLDSDKKYFGFVKSLIDISYNKEKLELGFNTASNAFKKVFTEKCATFDIGYSGRLQSIISELSDRQIDAFYIHSNGYNTAPASKHKFKIHTFCDYTPTITGIVREYFMSAPEPSCVSYRIEGGKIYPVFEEKDERHSYDSVFAVKEMQAGAISFSRKYFDLFSDMPYGFTARKSDYSVAFDYLLLSAKEFDRYTFVNSLTEDEVYSGYSSKNIYEIWSWHLSVLEKNPYSHKGVLQPALASESKIISVYSMGKFKKALFYLIFDRNTFKSKFKERFKRHKIFLAVSAFLYSAARFFYRAFKKLFRKK